MRRYFKVAMEENEEVIDTPTDAEVESSVNEVVAKSEQLQSESDAIEEGSDSLDTVSELTEQVEVAASKDGMDESTAAVVGIATEHIRVRLGYKKDVLPAMEGFADSSKRLENTKVTLENLKTLHSVIGKSLNVAQEGLTKRFANTLQLAFTSQKKIRANIEKNIKDLEEKGSSDKVINEPGWGRSFARNNTDVMKSSEVIKYLTIVDKFFTQEVSKISQDMINVLLKLSQQKKRGDSSDALRKGFDELDKVLKEVKDIEQKNSALFEDLKTSKSDPDYESLNLADGKKVANLALNIIANKAADKVLDELFEVSWKTWDDISNAPDENGFKKDDAVSDLTSAIGKRLSESLKIIWETLADRQRIAFAASKYIKASTK